MASTNILIALSLEDRARLRRVAAHAGGWTQKRTHNEMLSMYLAAKEEQLGLGPISDAELSMFRGTEAV